MNRKEYEATQAPILTAVSTAQADITAQAKKLALARRERSPVSVEKMPEVLEAWERYIAEAKASKSPLTWHGFALAGNMSIDTLKRMRNGSLDHIVEEYKLCNDIPEDVTEYTTEDGLRVPLCPYSLYAQKIEALIGEQLEKNLYHNANNPIGSIFALKSMHNWREDEPQAVHNTLIVADKSRALELLELTRGKP